MAIYAEKRPTVLARGVCLGRQSYVSPIGRVWGHATGLPSWVGNPRGPAHVVGRSTHARATSAETDGRTDHVLVRAAPEEAPHDPSFCQKKSTLPKEVK